MESPRNTLPYTLRNPLPYAPPSLYRRTDEESRWGVGSIAAWLPAVLLWLLFLYLKTTKPTPGAEAWHALTVVVLALHIFVLLAFGIVAGICGIVQPVRSSRAAIAGLVMHGFLLICVCVSLVPF